MDKDSFVFYRSWKDSIDYLPEDAQLQLYRAIVDYACNSVADINNPFLMAVFSEIKRQIDNDAEKYESIKRKRSEAGKKGNQKRWSESQKIANIANATDAKQNIANIAVYEDVDVYVDVSSKEDNNIEPKGSLSETKVSDSPKGKFPQDVEGVINYLNEKVQGSAIKPVFSIKTGSKFHKSIQARLREYGEETIMVAIDKAIQSRFLNGYNNKGWQATADWIFLPNNFEKIINGNYDNNNGTNTQQQQMSSKWADFMARVEQECRSVDAAN